MTEEEKIDAALVALGYDPKKVAKTGGVFVKALFENQALRARVQKMEAVVEAARDALKVLLANPASKVECIGYDTLAAALAALDSEKEKP